ncbi:DUF2946 domain-containing protein [Bradyrhizobium sp. STM 3562]|uniref:DUF2946 domain-containing protein n=1 Tax=Bradyrhizobium sp. STM 3562 TaxID=578924 RepID=UPI00388D39F0
MRRRLQKFLPVVLIALAVQVLAPIAACWAAALAASDPLPLAEICHSIGDASGQDDQGGHPAHDGACAMCCLLQASGSVDAPRMFTVWTPYRQPTVVVWREPTSGFSALRTGSNAQARAPPSLS